MVDTQQSRTQSQVGYSRRGRSGKFLILRGGAASTSHKSRRWALQTFASPDSWPLKTDVPSGEKQHDHKTMPASLSMVCWSRPVAAVQSPRVASSSEPLAMQGGVRRQDTQVQVGRTTGFGGRSRSPPGFSAAGDFFCLLIKCRGLIGFCGRFEK
jgi:hypothetical protein